MVPILFDDMNPLYCIDELAHSVPIPAGAGSKVHPRGDNGRRAPFSLLQFQDMTDDIEAVRIFIAQKGDVSKATRRSYMQQMLRYLIWLRQHYPAFGLCDVTSQQLVEYFRFLQSPPAEWVRNRGGDEYARKASIAGGNRIWLRNGELNPRWRPSA